MSARCRSATWRARKHRPGADDPALPDRQKRGRTRSRGRLRGKAGSQRVEVNSVGRVMRELDRVEGEPGENLHLTIDARLQNYALERLAGQSAAAVVIDVASGDVLAVGLCAQLRREHVRARHFQHRITMRLAGKRLSPAGQQMRAGHVSARLDLQDGDGAGRAGRRRNRRARTRLLPRPHGRVGQPLSLLEARGHGQMDLVSAWPKAATCISTRCRSAAGSTASTPCPNGLGWVSATTCR